VGPRRAAILAALTVLAAGCAGTDDAAQVPPGTPVPASTTTVAASTVPPPAPTATVGTVAPPSQPPPAVVPTTAAPPPPSTAVEATARDLSGFVVAVDPGHNGANADHAGEIGRLVDIGTRLKECDTTGATSVTGFSESSFNVDVAQRLAGLLGEMGATVVLTRPDDTGWGPCIDERAAVGNRAGADAAVSIHADGGPPGGRGFHVMYPADLPGLTTPIVEPSRRLAVAVRDALEAGTPLAPSTYIGRDGLMARDDLGGLNLSTVPKVFVETGNLGNAADAGLLGLPEVRQQLAQAIADGLAEYLAGA
jgi:N-acetylmuramoyl-L-alanine amidase